MVKEIDWQATLVKQFKAEGAYARKASSTYAVGVLDLDVIMPAFGAMKIEVKLEKGLKRDRSWSRTIDYTEKQKEEAEKVIAAKGMAMGLVVCHYDNANIDLYAQMLPAVGQSVVLTKATADLHGLLWRNIKQSPQRLSEFMFNAWVTRRV